MVKEDLGLRLSNFLSRKSLRDLGVVIYYFLALGMCGRNIMHARHLVLKCCQLGQMLPKVVLEGQTRVGG